MTNNAWVEQAWVCHRVAVLRYIVFHLEGECAEDALSDVFAIALSTADFTPDSDLAWLLGIARNVIRDHRRKALKRGIETSFASHTEVAHADFSKDVDVTDSIARAIQKLNKSERDVLGLALVQELEPAECAEILGISVGNFYTRLSRAKQKLGRLLEVMEVRHG